MAMGSCRALALAATVALSSGFCVLPTARPSREASSYCRGACVATDGDVLYRPGQPGDEVLIASTMFKEKMNPLGIKHARFIVATDAAGTTLGFGQIRELGADGALWELASLYVLEDWRGRGVGSELARRLLAGHEAAGRALSALYLLTLEPTTPFYETFGFRSARSEEVPKEMALEVAAGTALSFVLGNKLVCMRHAGSTD